MVYELSEPSEHGMLDVGDGHRLYWEVRGNPAGKPAVMLHGGPGGGGHAPGVRAFDPDAYRIVTFDQRNCGRSTPHAGELDVDLSTNTTPHLIGDLERLRTHLGIERWLVWGGSWGVTLALAYAEQHPERVSELILTAVTMTRAQDVRWLAHEAGRFFPAAWHEFRSHVPEGDRADLVAAYDRRMNHGVDPADRVRAALQWCAWEDALLSLDGPYAGSRVESQANTICFARIVTHYFSHAAWLGDDQLLERSDRLAGIPGVLLHGRLDVSGPPDVPWMLARRWPDAELHLFDAGHLGNAEEREVMVAAADRFRHTDRFRDRR